MLLVPVWLAFEALAVGETCPAAVDVEAHVRSILHLSQEQTLNESFLVERHEAGLYVELRGTDNSLIGQRTLPSNGNCDELAQAAAVVLVAWLSDVHPDFAGDLPAPEAPPAEAPAEEGAEVVSGARVPPDEAKTPKPPPASSPPVPGQRYGWDFALGVGADSTGGELAVAGIAEAGYLPRRSGIGLSAMVAPTTPRQRPLGPGNFEWRRWPVGLGPTLRLSSSSIVWDFTGGALLAWLRFAGNVFDRTFVPNGAAWGGFLSARAATRGRRWRLFGLIEGQLYPGETEVYATGVAEKWKMPALSVGMSVGVRFSP